MLTPNTIENIPELSDYLKDSTQPCYFFSLDILKTNYRNLQDAVGEETTVLYSMKTNSNFGVLKELSYLGAGVECSSREELSIALRYFSPEKIWFSGPAKTNEDFQFCLDSGITSFSIESAHQYSTLAHTWKNSQNKLSIVFRVNPSEHSSAGLNMSGRSTQFGIDEDDFNEIELDLVPGQKIKNLGLHVYYGTQMNELEISSRFQSILGLARKLEEQYGLKFNCVNLGGGFPSPYGVSKAEKPNLSVFRNNWRSGLSNLSSRLKLFCESGRYLVSDIGLLRLQVVDVKKSKGKNYLVLNGGINVVGGLNISRRIIPINYDLMQIKDHSQDDLQYKKFVVVGPTCTPVDILSREASLYQPEVGEDLFIPNIGAYGGNLAFTDFILHEIPSEVCIKNNRVSLILTKKRDWKTIESS